MNYSVKCLVIMVSIFFPVLLIRKGKFQTGPKSSMV